MQRGRLRIKHRDDVSALFKHVKADSLDISGLNAEAVAFLLPDLCQAEIFCINILNGETMGLLFHQVIEAGRFCLDSLGLTARGILRDSACGMEQRQKKHQFTHAFE